VTPAAPTARVAPPAGPFVSPRPTAPAASSVASAASSTAPPAPRAGRVGPPTGPARRARPVPPAEDGEPGVELPDADEVEEFSEYVLGSPFAWLLQPSRGFVMPGRPWAEAPIYPVVVTLPGGRGYTIRAQFVDPDETLFLDRDDRPLLFRSTGGLARHLDTDDHLLAELAGWPEVKDWFNHLVLTPDKDDVIDFELIPYLLDHPPQEWVPDVLVAARDLAVALSTVFDLAELSKLLAPGSPLDQADDVLRAAQQSITGWTARRRLRNIDPAPVQRAWRRAITTIDQAVVWDD
jgi:hypothetical protein